MTLSISKSVIYIILYKSVFKPLLLENYICVVAFVLEFPKVSFLTVCRSSQSTVPAPSSTTLNTSDQNCQVCSQQRHSTLPKSSTSPPTYPLPSNTPRTPTPTRTTLTYAGTRRWTWYCKDPGSGRRELAIQWRVETDWGMKEPKQPKPGPGQNGVATRDRSGLVTAESTRSRQSQVILGIHGVCTSSCSSSRQIRRNILLYIPRNCRL